jgi:hypothetical protein
MVALRRRFPLRMRPLLEPKLVDALFLTVWYTGIRQAERCL